MPSQPDISSAFGDGRELVRVLKGQPVRIVSLTTITRPKMRKRQPSALSCRLFPGEDIPGLAAVNPFWSRGVIKIAQRIGLVAANYARAVQAQRRREAGETPALCAAKCRPSGFKPQPLWRGRGEHVDHYFVRHKETGQRYLKFLPTVDSRGVEQLVRVKYCWADKPDVEIDLKWLQPWLVVANQQPATQCTRRPVRWKTPRVEHVAEIRMGGEVHSFLDAKAWLKLGQPALPAETPARRAA